MFFSDKTLQALRNLSNALNRDPLENKLQAIRDLGKDIEQLPGDFKILVKEILAYSEDLPSLRKKNIVAKNGVNLSFFAEFAAQNIG